MLSGDFQNISLPSFFQLIQLERKTLTLILSQGDLKKKILFRDGAIGFVFSNDPRDFLGHFLLSQGLVAEDDLIQALRTQSQTRQLLGKIFSRIVDISEKTIRDLVVKKMKESIYALFFLENLSFVSDEEIIDWKSMPDVFELSTQSILMEALKRVDEFKRLRVKVPTNRMCFEVLRTDIPLAHPSRAALQTVVNLLRQGKTIDDLCLHFHTYDYNILKYIELLMDRGFIKPGAEMPKAETIQEPKRRNTVGACPSLVQLAEVTAQSGDTDKAIEIYKDILVLNPEHEIALKNLEILQGTIGTKKIKQEIKRQYIFEINQAFNLVQAELTPADGFILSRINGKWTVEEILSVTPLSEEQVLGSLGNLLENKMIRQVNQGG